MTVNGTRYYEVFEETGDAAWLTSEINGGSVTFNSDGSVRLQTDGAGSKAAIYGLQVEKPAGEEAGIFLLHDTEWTLPAEPTGNQGRLRLLLRDYNNTQYLNNIYARPAEADDVGVAIAINLHELPAPSGTDGFYVLGIEATYNEGYADIDVSIAGWSALFASQLQVAEDPTPAAGASSNRSSDNLVTLLTSDTSVTALVGSRVYVGHAPQSAVTPYVVVTLMNSDELQILSGTTGARIISYDIDCIASRSTTAEETISVIRDAIADYTGTINGDEIHSVIVESESCEYNAPQSGDGLGTHTSTLDVSVQYSAT